MRSSKIVKLVVKYHTRIQIDDEAGGMGGDDWRRHEYGIGVDVGIALPTPSGSEKHRRRSLPV